MALLTVYETSRDYDDNYKYNRLIYWNRLSIPFGRKAYYCQSRKVGAKRMARRQVLVNEEPYSAEVTHKIVSPNRPEGDVIFDDYLDKKNAAG